MLAASVVSFDSADPLSGLSIDDRPEPEARPGWEVVEVRAASLNRHDWWMLQGVSVVPVTPPVILGCDGAGVTADGRPVVIHAVLDDGPRFHMLSDGVDGTLAPLVLVPSRNLVDKPASLSFEEAATLPTAWLTAWSMLVRTGALRPGERVLVQGATGGLATAALVLAVAIGAEVTVTSRDASALAKAADLGAHHTAASGERLAEPVDVVIDSVGSATWAHSLRSLRFGGRLVCAGATSGFLAETDVRAVFRNELQILGHKVGTLDELVSLCDFIERRPARPVVAQVFDGVERTAEAMRAMVEDRPFGKVVVRVSG